jgi:hypothetical protein
MNESKSHPHTLFLNASFNIIFPKSVLNFFNLNFVFFICPTHSACPAHIILLDQITPIICGGREVPLCFSSSIYSTSSAAMTWKLTLFIMHPYSSHIPYNQRPKFHYHTKKYIYGFMYFHPYKNTNEIL